MPLEVPESTLASEVTGIFQALPLEGGIALVPRSPFNGIRTLEIRGEKVLVNGSPVTRGALGSWLEDAAPPVLELLDLPVAEQRRLFGFAPPAPSSQPRAEPEPETAPAAEAPPQPEVPSPEAPAVERAPTPPSPPRRERRIEPTVHSKAKVSIGKKVVVEENEVAEDLVVIGNSLEIDGEVLGDALAVGGSVRVDGRVSGDVASVGGTVYLEDDAQVHGNVVSVGGGIEREEGATVLGEQSEVAFGEGIFDSKDWFDIAPVEFTPHWPRPFRMVGRFFGGLGRLIFLVLVTSLVLLILPNQMRRAEAVLEREPWKAALAGLVGILVYCVVLVPVLIIAFIVLCITLIGIPVAILLLLAFILFSIALALLAYTSAASRLGSWFAERFAGRFQGRFVRLLLGILLIEVWMFLASVLGGGGWILFLPVLFLGIFGWLVEFGAWTLGLGAVLTSWYEGGAQA
ncbi:MAG: polymer-forming cytoskeletal protein, partial [Acidobacteria bacterium]|nr:polymer-forming cytoskeletal protein [Acidobacteriota bacterium]